MDILKIQPKKLSLTNYNLLQNIGSGSFGIVKLAIDKQTGKYYAIKIQKKSEIIKKKQVDHIMNEIRILTIINHPFLIKTSGFSQNEKYIYIILEFINGGDLFTYLRKKGNFSLDLSTFYASQIVLIFEYLHSKNIIYRDLKPENILINKNGYLKLTDFGFAKIVEGRTYTLCGTPEYLAPEILLNKGHGKPVDWWTLGILLYEMLVGIDPFNDDEPMGIYKKIIKGKVKFPSNFNEYAQSLIKHLLKVDLSKRFGNLKKGVLDIKEHKFFRNVNWSLVLDMKIKPKYVPNVKSDGDCKYFNCDIKDDWKDAIKINKNEDPFVDW